MTGFGFEPPASRFAKANEVSCSPELQITSFVPPCEIQLRSFSFDR